MRVGVMGCGVISRAYVENASAFDSYEIVACADLDEAQARALGKASGLAVVTVDELLADPMIDVILNLTPPLAHAAVTTRALASGKHVYTEKPLATDSAEAAALAGEAPRLGLPIGPARRRGRGRGARGRAQAPRAAHRLRARHLPRLGLPGRARRDRRRRHRRA